MVLLLKQVDDCSTIYDIIKGFDEKDATTIPNDYYKSVSYNSKSIKIGYSKSLLERCSQSVQKSFTTVIEELKKDGHQFIDINLPYLEYAYPNLLYSRSL